MDKPIIFSAPMVRALLDGRKTQTRRLLKPKNHNTDLQCNGRGEWWWWTPGAGAPHIRQPVPYAVGDRLYVREAFWSCEECGYLNHVVGANSAGTGDRRCCASCDAMLPKAKRSPIHMPRSRSRLTLTVTEVRVQRLQDISDRDAMAEGIERLRSGRGFYDPTMGKGMVHLGHKLGTARAAYALLWDSLHGDGAWRLNPWVAAYTFTVNHGNIYRSPA